jgi:hypothetical protein
MEVRSEMGLDNVAVRWPRTARYYEPVAPAEFAEFAALADKVPPQATTAADLARTIAATATVPATPYTALVDLLLGLTGVLRATDAAAEDEDPVIDPDGCAWIAGGLERFVVGHRELGDRVTFHSVGTVLRAAVRTARLADQQLQWLERRLDALRDERGDTPAWDFPLTELGVLARFYRHCAEQGLAVFANERDG